MVNKDKQVDPKTPVDTGKRNFLKSTSTYGALLAAGAVASSASHQATADDYFPRAPDLSAEGDRRAKAAFDVKVEAARRQRLVEIQAGPQLDNNDEVRYADQQFYASFTKTLPSNEFGEADASAFESLQAAMRTGVGFDTIPLDASAGRGLANPQGAFNFEMYGLDCHGTRINPSHSFRSAELAGEMAEVYWQAITRDVPFSEYSTDALIASAAIDLNNFSATPGESANGITTPENIFRGETTGDLAGPYISQFLWQDFNFGPVAVEQKYATPLAGVDFMVDIPNWLNIQRGGAPLEVAAFDAQRRYIFNNRSLAEYVHVDVSFQAYLHAALILLSYGRDALDDGNPYKSSITNQGAFTSLGGPFILDLVTKAAKTSLTGAWFQKWRVHRLLRPEALAARVNFHVAGARAYELHPDILASDALAVLSSNNGNLLLPSAYVEGSPTHPSYPAGHATIAGACVTILKGFFDENFVIPSPVVANADGSELLNYSGGDLTVGDELNKLANNISIGRDAAGVHYRQDGIQGCLAGEQQAIAMLRDQSTTLNEEGFEGFTLTKFDGTQITIKDGDIL